MKVIAQLLVKLVARQASRTVSKILKVDSRRQSIRLNRNYTHEIPGLVDAGSAQREEVIRASANACRSGGLPVFRESSIYVIAAFGGLNVSEVDSLLWHSPPFDPSLVM